MTSLEKLRRAERWRLKLGTFATTEVDGWNGSFLVPLDGELWHVRISDGMGWKHLSISNGQKKMLPSWGVMSRVKELFFGDDEWAVQFMPAKEDNISDHPYCLHIWSPLNETMPRPLTALV